VNRIKIVEKKIVYICVEEIFARGKKEGREREKKRREKSTTQKDNKYFCVLMKIIIAFLKKNYIYQENISKKKKKLESKNLYLSFFISKTILT